MCLDLDGYDVVTTFNLERKLWVIENIMDKSNEQTHYVINLKSKPNFIKDTTFS
jgi:hypothetical protein